MMTNSHAETSQIKFISECFVKPKHEVEASKQPHYLGIVDLGFLAIDQLQKGLLFPTKPNNIQSDLLHKLTKSLSISLVHFYPLAGQFATKNYPDEEAICVYLDCNKGPGARVIHASADVTVGDLMSSVDVHPIISSLFDFSEKAVNHDGHIRPLLSIQVTELLDGVFIGFTMNHSLVDGTTQWQFISALSEIFLQMNEGEDDNVDDELNISISQKPIFRTYFPDGYGPIIKMPAQLLKAHMEWRSDAGLLRERIFHFSSATLSKLKAKAKQECGVHNISSFQALSALIWRSITRARNLQLDDVTTLALAMNARSRFNPPLSDEYFGNLIVRSRKMCKASELLSNGIGWAAAFVHELVINQDDKATRGFFEEVAKLICGAAGPSDQFNEPNLVMIGGSARFDMYGPEFGLGKAIAVLAGYSNKEDGKVTASPGREGGGSVDLEICLRPERMNALELDEEFMSYVTQVGK